jgi:hypothetical protein
LFKQPRRGERAAPKNHSQRQQFFVAIQSDFCREFSTRRNVPATLGHVRPRLGTMFAFEAGHDRGKLKRGLQREDDETV